MNEDGLRPATRRSGYGGRGSAPPEGVSSGLLLREIVTILHYRVSHEQFKVAWVYRQAGTR